MLLNFWTIAYLGNLDFDDTVGNIDINEGIHKTHSIAASDWNKKN